MKILLIALLVTISYLSVAQSPCNSSNSLSDTLDKESFNRIINNQFTNLVKKRFVVNKGQNGIHTAYELNIDFKLKTLFNTFRKSVKICLIRVRPRLISSSTSKTHTFAKVAPVFLSIKIKLVIPFGI